MDRLNTLVSMYRRLQAPKIHCEDIVKLRENYMERREKMKVSCR